MLSFLYPLNKALAHKVCFKLDFSIFVSVKKSTICCAIALNKKSVSLN